MSEDHTRRIRPLHISAQSKQDQRIIESLHLAEVSPSRGVLARTSIFNVQEAGMRIEGDYTFNAAQEVVFNLLQDPDALAGAMPGNTVLTKVGEDLYEGQVSVKIGSISGNYAGTVAVRDSVRPEHFRLVVEGRGAAGFLKGEGTIDLEPVPDGTLIRYAGETQVGGRIAQVGQRLVETVARKMINSGLQSLESQLANRGSDGVAPSETESVAPVAPTDP